MAYNFNGWEPTQVNSSIGSLLQSTSASEGALGDNGIPFNATEQADVSQFYSSYSGVDISATIIVPGTTSPTTFGTLRTISYSVVRDKRPLRVLGSMNPICWARSNRLIAGTLIFTSLDRYVWFQLTGNTFATSGILLADMLPPFDITLTALNEYGSSSRMSIRGVRIVDEGAVVGVDDLYVEQSHTWVAQDMVPWVPSDIEQTTNNFLAV